MECINLKQQYGHLYRLTHDESFDRQRVDPWMHIIQCKNGEIIPWGGELLAAAVGTGHTKTAESLKQLRCIDVAQDGDDGELTAVFHVKDFDLIAEFMKPHKKRQVSTSERQRLKQLSEEHGFQKPVASAGGVGIFTLKEA